MAAPMRRTWGSLRLRSLSKILGQQPLQCRCISVALDGSDPTKSSTEGSLAEQFKKATESSRQGQQPRRVLCRTSEDDPAKHSTAHEGLFYTVPPEHADRWFSKIFRPPYARVIKAFNETCIMVRRPALEIKDYLGVADYSLPVIRYILYGRNGSGKSVTLGHILHHVGTQNWLVVHLPWPNVWNRYPKEVQVSQYNPSRIDLPIDAAEWLTYFSTMNAPLIKELDLKINNRYVWSKREVTEPGTPWLEAIDFAISRVKYAPDVVGMILKEIRQQASAGRFKAMVAIDGVNCFWNMSSIKHPEEKTLVPAGDVSLIHNFKKMLRNDWSGGAVLCTVDVKANQVQSPQKSNLPKFLLQKEGFELLDPYVPVEVTDYSDKEVHSCLEYFIDRNWIQHPKGRTEEGKKELIFLSSKNPLGLYKVTAPL